MAFLPPLEDISLGRRFILAFMLILIAALGVEAFEDSNYPAEAQISEPQLYEGIPLDATLLHLDRQALNDAYHEYVLLIMGVYLKGDLADDRRASAGFKKARAAYNIVASQIAKREQELLQQDRLKQNRMP